MDTPKYDVMTLGCPSRVIMQRIGDKWTPLVIASLQDGSRRFSQLRAGIGGVTPKVLTQTLRTLERDGLIGRTVHAEVPVRVEYELTEVGRTLLGPLETIRIWAETHAEGILEARDEYDERTGA